MLSPQLLNTFLTFLSLRAACMFAHIFGHSFSKKGEKYILFVWLSVITAAYGFYKFYLVNGVSIWFFYEAMEIVVCKSDFSVTEPARKIFIFLFQLLFIVRKIACLFDCGKGKRRFVWHNHRHIIIRRLESVELVEQLPLTLVRSVNHFPATLLHHLPQKYATEGYVMMSR